MSASTLASCLLSTLSEVLSSGQYSDLQIETNDGTALSGHRLVFAARGIETDEGQPLKLTHLSGENARHLLRWLYTDKICDTIDLNGLSTLLETCLTSDFSKQLAAFASQIEVKIGTLVSVENCVKLLEFALKLKAERLLPRCERAVAENWMTLHERGSLAQVTPNCLVRIARTEFGQLACHRLVSTGSVDLVSCFIDSVSRSELTSALRLSDSDGLTPLAIALKMRNEPLSDVLVTAGADILDPNLVHGSCSRRDAWTLKFLLTHGADPNAKSTEDPTRTPLHSAVEQNDVDLVECLLADSRTILDPINSEGRTPLQLSLCNSCRDVFPLLLRAGVDLAKLDADSASPLSLALRYSDDPDFYATALVQAGADPDEVDLMGTSLLSSSCVAAPENAILLIDLKANPSLVDDCGISPLHVASAFGHGELVDCLLRAGADSNAQTTGEFAALNLNVPEEQHVEQRVLPTPKPKPTRPPKVKDNPFDDSEESENGDDDGDMNENLLVPATSQPVVLTGLTALHVALLRGHGDIVQILLAHSKTDVRLKDSQGCTPFAIALWTQQHALVPRLLVLGVDADQRNANGATLLHQAILLKDVASALLLIEHGADVNARVKNTGATCLELAVDSQAIVAALCKRGIDANARQSDGNVPLWSALSKGNFSTAEQLVGFGADVDAWFATTSSPRIEQTLLDLAIGQLDEASAVFLIENGSDPNECIRYTDVDGGDEPSLSTPLYRACDAGLAQAVRALVKAGARVDTRVKNETALHAAIRTNDVDVTQALLETSRDIDVLALDNERRSPLEAALECGNIGAAHLIANREPRAVDLRRDGRTQLHEAVTRTDLRSLLFLIELGCDVNALTEDTGETALHMASRMTVNEDRPVLRTLLLAPEINVSLPILKSKKTALHLACEGAEHLAVSALLQNITDPNMRDAQGNTPLHLAIKAGSPSCVSALLSDPRVLISGLRNQVNLTPMLTLGTLSGQVAVEILHVILDARGSDAALEEIDSNGNSPLLLAFLNGNADLCCAFIEAGSCMGHTNQDGSSIFSLDFAQHIPVSLLLSSVMSEPPQAKRDFCQECATKFSVLIRRHHCRHCGRSLCNKCSSHQVTITKFGSQSPSRICNVCDEVLTGTVHGATGSTNPFD